jgi:hypothetical protein
VDRYATLNMVFKLGIAAQKNRAADYGALNGLASHRLNSKLITQTGMISYGSPVPSRWGKLARPN